jgi:DegV family protein with EDD domain
MALCEIALVTDSTADIPADVLEACSLEVVPAILVMNGQSLQDGAQVSRQEFYERLPEIMPPPTTAAPASGIFGATYEKLLQQGAQYVISVHAASQLSGIYNAASVAAQSFGERVHVIDSGMVTLGLGFQALAALEAIRQGAALAGVLARMEDVRRRARVIAMLNTLEYVRRSGRVSWAKASLGALLNLKLFVELREGIVHRTGEARTRKKAIERLVQMLHAFGPLEQLAVLHTNAEEDARQLAEMLAPEMPHTPRVVNVTTVIGTHVGPNALGFAAIVK